jgi:hypothetical protein
VTISSVCPRLDSVKEMVEPFNVSLEMLCQDSGATFIDNTPILTLGDGSVNDGYLVDGKGPHLTKAGVNKLARNLRLEIKDTSKDVTKAPGKHPNNKSHQNTAGKYGAGYSRSSQSSVGTVSTSSNQTGAQTQGRASDKVWFNNGRCVYCNEPGHNSSTCRHQGAVTCHSCGKKGHKAKHHGQ